MMKTSVNSYRMNDHRVFIQIARDQRNNSTYTLHNPNDPKVVEILNLLKFSNTTFSKFRFMVQQVAYVDKHDQN